MPILSDPAVKAAKPKHKPYKLFDGDGLHLYVSPKGGRSWRFKYHFGGRERLLTLGLYPAVGLKLARERRDDARRTLGVGKDPGVLRKAAKAAQVNTFGAVADEWFAKQRHLTESTRQKDTARLRTIRPTLGNRPVAEIDAQELLAELRRIETRGRLDTAHRTMQLCGRIFRYAVATGRARRDITADLRGALAPYVSRNFPAITEPRRIGELLRAIDGYSGQPATAYALKLAPLVFVRPGELRAAQWSEFDLDKAVWRIPEERMKAREPHVVPLATQAVALLEELEAITGPEGYLFPSLTSRARPISENTINAALRRLGYSTKDEMTGHGFRSMASTCLNEQGFAPDVIELQLAHAERDQVRGAYNRATRMAERKAMMQAWADYLDGLRAAKPSPASRA